MKVEIAEFSKQLAKLKRFMPTNSSQQELNGILVKNGKLQVYDLESSLNVPFSAAGDAVMLLPSKAIDTILSLPQNGSVSVTTNDNQTTVTIETGSVKSRFSTFSPDEYPAVPEFTPSSSCAVDGEQLCLSISEILYAVSSSEAKPIHTGVLLDADGDQLNVVSCDGYRAAWQQIPFKDTFKAVIPKKACMMLISLGMPGTAKLMLCDKFAVFETAEYTLYTRLLQGEFINYRAVFPKHDNSIKISGKSLSQACSRAVICSDKKISSPLVIDIADGVASISMESPVGTYSEDIMLCKPEDKAIRIGFNARYLGECLKSYTTDELEISFSTPGSPMVVCAANYKALVLPVRMKK